MTAHVVDDDDLVGEDLPVLTAADHRRIRRAAARERLAQADFQRLRTLTVGSVLRGHPLLPGERWLVEAGGGPVAPELLAIAGVLQ